MLQEWASTVRIAPCSPPRLGRPTWVSLRDFDLKLSWDYKMELKSHVIELQPGVGFYNLFNFANFDLPPNTLDRCLTNSRALSTALPPQNASPIALGPARAYLTWARRAPWSSACASRSKFHSPPAAAKTAARCPAATSRGVAFFAE